MNNPTDQTVNIYNKQVANNQFEKVDRLGPELYGSSKMNNPTDQTVNIHNKLVANNQFTSQLPNIFGNVYPSWNNHQGQPFNIQQQVFNSQSQLFNIQQQVFNSQGQPVNLQEPLFAFVPTAVLIPFLSPVPSLQNYHQLLAQTSLHNNSTLIQEQEQLGQNQRTPIKRPFNNRNDWNGEQYHREEITFNDTNGSDLRTKLMRKRICGATLDNNHADFKHDKSTTRRTQKKIKPQSTPALQAKPLTLAPLKTLTATNSETHQWLIVVETDIILENYTFLDDLVTADPDCQLGIPHHVMSELRMHVSMSSDVRPRRTLRFLTQQIENGMAILGEQEEGYNSSSNTILTFVKLATRNNVAILITNNKETLTFKPNRKGMHLFTMRDVKDILANKFPKQRASSPTVAIKIAVPNHLNNEKETRDPENNITRELFNHYNQSNSNNDKPDTPPSPATKNDIIVHKQASNVVAPLISPKQTTKAVPCNFNAVDVEEVSESLAPRDELFRRGSATFIAPTDPNRANFHHTSKINNPVSDSNAAPQYTPTKPKFATPRKDYNSNCNRTGNKNMLDTMNTSSTLSTSKISLDSNIIKNKKTMKKLTTSTSKRQIDNVKEITAPIIGSKSPNGEPNLEKTLNKNQAMGENSASTSGVINSKSFNSDKVINPKKQNVKRVSSRRSFVMYEVVGQSMEEVLRLRSEEWVLRFVQIMEEVLRVKLQEEIPNEKKKPAPLNLIEAAQCIIPKFARHFDVIQAANNLAQFVDEISNHTGRIINIEPSDYMELYSHGVFLVETFLDMCTDCREDETKKNEKRGSFSGEKCSCYEVGTASELLNKLLLDIHNANLETFEDEEIDNPPVFLTDASVNDSTHYDSNIKKQSSKEVDKINANEINNAENMKSLPIKRKHFDSLLQVAPNPKKNKNASMNGPQSTKKVHKAAGADEFPSSSSNVKEADVEVLPKVMNITVGTRSDSAFVSELRHVKEDLNNADKRKACKVLVVCSNTPHAPDEQKVPSRSSPEEFLDLKCHYSKDNLLEKLPQKVSCIFKINEDFERIIGGNSANEKFKGIPVDDNLNELTTNGNHLSFKNNVHKDDKIIEDAVNDKFQKHLKKLGLSLTKMFTKVKSLCTHLEKNEESYCKLRCAIMLLEGVQKSLKSAKKHDPCRSENSEDYLNDDRFSLQYRRFIAKCERSTKKILEEIRGIMNTPRHGYSSAI